jgi:4-hydroxy-tetrahydrodipicolinate synthase
MKTFDFTGTGVALVTPFNDKGKMDLKAHLRLIKHLQKRGIDYVVVSGTTGESATLSADEKQELLDATIEAAKGKMYVIMGIGGNHTVAVCEQLQKMNLKGVSAVLSVSPYYNKPGQRGIISHFKEVTKASPVPVILYNVPGRTGLNMTAETTLELAATCKNAKAIKEASGNLEQCMRIVAGAPKGFTLISGDDNLTLPMMAIGAKGVISVTAQAVPEPYSRMVNHCLKGNFTRALPLHYAMMPLTDLLFADGSPAGIKAALHALDICSEQLRLPLVPVSPAIRKQIVAKTLEIHAGFPA